ncbi:MAG: hypothetical protein A3F10_03590 [Coxiella sp. RIFCSPHIGHO2_12_FULL_42_15]|nr:MAG: hypothetical protein A3F10_03590 [Coxiella sp. RIFCSPHIGHO2_12_FULL_42_15]
MSLLKIPKRYRKPFLLAAVLHIALAIVLMLQVSPTQYRWQQNAAIEPNIVNATAIDAAQLAIQLNKIKSEQKAKQQQETEHLRQLEQKAVAYRQNRLVEERRLKEIQLKQQQMKEQQLAQEKALQQQQKEEQSARQKALEWKKKVSDMKKRELAEQQEKLQKRLLEQQLKAEQQQIHKTTQQLNQANVARLDGLADEFRAKILQAIENNWHPLVQDAKLTCQFLVHLAPGGMVTGVDLLQSSGDVALDRSARLAILKASPLPVPQDQALFDRFREFRIKMSPQDIKG